MADKERDKDQDRTPTDLLESLLAGKKAPGKVPEKKPEEDTIKPESQPTGIPAEPTVQDVKKPVRRKRSTKPEPAPVQEEPSGEKVKATYYISVEAVEALEEGWIQLRRLTPKDKRSQTSKSLIVELAVQMALEELESKGDKSKLAKRISKE